MLAAKIHHSRHLPVDWVQAELFLSPLPPAEGCLHWQRQLEGLQELGLVVIEVGDAIHGHSALSEQTGDAVDEGQR